MQSGSGGPGGTSLGQTCDLVDEFRREGMCVVVVVVVVVREGEKVMNLLSSLTLSLLPPWWVWRRS